VHIARALSSSRFAVLRLKNKTTWIKSDNNPIL